MKNIYIEIWDKAESRIYSYWNIYVIIVVAISGWLFSKGNDLEFIEKLIITSGFILFAFFNIKKINGNNKILDAISKNFMGYSSGVNDPIIKSLVGGIGNHALAHSFVIHLAIDLCVILAIWT